MFGIYLCNMRCRTAPEGSGYHSQPALPCELEVPVSKGGAIVVTGSVHTVAALFSPTPVPGSHGALGKASFPGCEFKRNMPEQTFMDLCLTIPSIKASHPEPSDLCKPQPPHRAEGAMVPRRLHCQKEACTGNSSTSLLAG